MPSKGAQQRCRTETLEGFPKMEGVTTLEGEEKLSTEDNPAI